MSFSNAPDAFTLGRVAGALAVDEAFVEKDWFVVEAIRILVQQGSADLVPVFSGGTSLLKGHGLIKRFSEDIDFKLALSDGFVAAPPGRQRKVLSTFKHALARAWETAGFAILGLEAANANAFIRIELGYPSVLRGHDALRPHVLAELSATPPRLAPCERSLTSFVARFRQQAPEVPAIPCIDPVETAADKLSAFAWRVLVRERGAEKDDPAIVRHVHDLAALESLAAGDVRFGALLRDALVADSDRGQGAVAHLPPRERLAAMFAALDEDPGYADDYRRFVEAMAFAAPGEVPGYEAALDAVRRIAAALPG